MGRYRKVLVLYPRGQRTGGPEALHQLVDSLRRQGQEAFLVPLDATRDRERDPAFAHYDAPEVVGLEDHEDNAVVVPETQVAALTAVRSARKFYWWLSVPHSPVARALGGPHSPESWAATPPSRRVLDRVKDRIRARQLLRDQSVVHLAQSTYAWAFARERVGLAPTSLSDYVRLNHPAVSHQDAVPRWQVSYNGSKGAAQVEAIAAVAPGISFVPLRNLSRAEVEDTLSRSHVYLDLGSHPGKDRLPREAALCGALVIVGRNGSAAWHEDVPLPGDHKLRPDEHSPAQLAAALREVLADLPAQVTRQRCYRQRILHERTVFDYEALRVFVADDLGRDPAQSRFDAGAP